MRAVYFALALLPALLPELSRAAEERHSSRRVLEIPVETAIEPVTVEILEKALEEAAQEGDELVILRLNTPGGLMDAMRAMISSIESSHVPVAAYVAPSGGRAASAGFFLLEASDIAAMAPGTNTGAAHPVAANGEMDAVMKEKVTNDAAAAMRSMTAKRGRNSALAETAVRESKSFTEHEALEGGLIEIVARDEKDLLAQLDGRAVKRFRGDSATLHVAGGSIRRFGLSLRQKTLVVLSDPNLALILLVVGALGIYLEFNAPGLILPGVAGSLCGLIALASLSVLPISWLGALLLVMAAVFFALELKFASHGALGAGGAVALVLGSMLLVDGPIPEMRIRLGTALGIVLPFAVITAFLASIAARARRNKAAMGAGGMIGLTAVAVENLEPTGRVLARGEYWTASASAPVKSGERVKVVAMDGLQLRVARMGEK